MASQTLNDKTPRHALVYGASGLSGWATVDQLLSNYPTAGTFSKVTALVNRSLSFQNSFWPVPTADSPELQLVSGANLLSGSVDDFAGWLREHIKDVENVSHIYYFAMAPYDDSAEEVQGNLAMAERAIGAIEQLSSNLQFVAFPGGARRYGIYLPERPYSAPFQESMPRIEGLGKVNLQIYYYALEDQLDEMSKGKKWTWCEINPDAIIGFTPNGSNFSLAAHWALYLSTYALVEGKGAKVPFPGIEACYVSNFNEASAGMIAKTSIWASLNPHKVGESGIYNVADRAEPSSMIERWPAICTYFGLEGVGPDGDESRLKPGEYVAAHKDALEKHGLQRKEVFKGHFLDEYGFHFAGDRSFDLSKGRNAGFTEELDPNVAWFRAFDLFRKSGQIPG